MPVMFEVKEGEWSEAISTMCIPEKIEVRDVYGWKEIVIVCKTPVKGEEVEVEVYEE